LSRIFFEISEKVQKSLITHLPAPLSVGTACLTVGRDYATITTIRNVLKINVISCKGYVIEGPVFGTVLRIKHANQMG